MDELERVTQLAWRKFLSSEYGVKGLLHLRERTPTVAKGESHSMVYDAGRVDGYRQCLDHLKEIIAAEQVREINIDNP